MFTGEEDKSRFTIICDGNMHLRQLLLPECIKKNFELPAYFFKYYDLRKEFAKIDKNQLQTKGNSLNIEEMLKCNISRITHK